MIKMAICDDEYTISHALNDLVEQYASQNKISVSVFIYNNAEDLVEYCDTHHCDFDIIFFDIIMDGMDGLTCARQLRQQSRLTKFIFLTNSNEYVFAGYEVNAYRYILKPFDQTKIFPILQQVIQEISAIKQQTVDIKSHGKIYRIPLDDIIMAEITNNAIVLTLANNQPTLTLYEKLDDFIERANYNFFIRIHKSYAVNFLYIETYKADTIILKNNISLSISRTYKTNVRNSFFHLLHIED